MIKRRVIRSCAFFMAIILTATSAYPVTIIYVSPGTYNEKLVINAPVDIRGNAGVGENPPILQPLATPGAGTAGTDYDIFFADGSSGSTLENFTLDFNGSDGSRAGLGVIISDPGATPTPSAVTEITLQNNVIYAGIGKPAIQNAANADVSDLLIHGNKLYSGNISDTLMNPGVGIQVHPEANAETHKISITSNEFHYLTGIDDSDASNTDWNANYWSDYPNNAGYASDDYYLFATGVSLKTSANKKTSDLNPTGHYLPRVVSITRTENADQFVEESNQTVYFDVEFSHEMKASSISVDDFNVTLTPVENLHTALAATSVLVYNNTQIPNTKWKVGVRLYSDDGNVDLAVKENGIQDALDYVLTVVTPTGDQEYYIQDASDPAVVSVQRANSATQYTNQKTTVTFTVTFNEPMASTLSNTDFIASRGTVGTPQTTDRIVWTVPVNLSSASDGDVTMTVNTTAADPIGNPIVSGTATGTNEKYTLDTTAPTVVIDSPSGISTTSSSFTATFTFAENVTGFDATDVTVNNGSKGSFLGSGAIYTLTVNANSLGTVSVSVAAGACVDVAGNNNVAGTFDMTYRRANTPTPQPTSPPSQPPVQQPTSTPTPTPTQYVPPIVIIPTATPTHSVVPTPTPIVISEQVGAQGGTITDDSGLKIEVPAGILASGTTLDAKIDYDLPEEVKSIVTSNVSEEIIPVVSITLNLANVPDDYQFTTPVEVTIPYSDDMLQGKDPSYLRVFWLNPSTGIWEEIPGATIDPITKTISIGLTHFSQYALGISKDAPTVPTPTPIPSVETSVMISAMIDGTLVKSGTVSKTLVKGQNHTLVVYASSGLNGLMTHIDVSTLSGNIIQNTYKNEDDATATANYLIDVSSVLTNSATINIEAWEEGDPTNRAIITLNVNFGGNIAKASLDLNGDGSSEMLWWNTIMGDIVVHFLNADDKSVIDSSRTLAQLPQDPWTIVGTANFDKNGPFDIVWYNRSNGTIISWNVTGGSLPSVDPNNDCKVVTVLPLTDWQPVSFGDLNGDGNDDIIWQNQQNGIVVGWTLDANLAVLSNNYVIQPDPDFGTWLITTGWKIIGTADFNNNGTLDLIWWNQIDGITIAWEGCKVTNQNIGIQQFDPAVWEPVGFTDIGNVLTHAKTPDGKTDVIWRNLVSGEVVANFYDGTDFSGVPGTRMDLILPLYTNWYVVGMN